MKVGLDTGVQHYFTAAGVVKGSFYRTENLPYSVLLKIDDDTSVAFRDGFDPVLVSHNWKPGSRIDVTPLPEHYAITIGG